MNSGHCVSWNAYAWSNGITSSTRNKQTMKSHLLHAQKMQVPELPLYMEMRPQQKQYEHGTSHNVGLWKIPNDNAWTGTAVECSTTTSTTTRQRNSRKTWKGNAYKCRTLTNTVLSEQRKGEYRYEIEKLWWEHFMLRDFASKLN